MLDVTCKIITQSTHPKGYYYDLTPTSKVLSVHITKNILHQQEGLSLKAS